MLITITALWTCVCYASQILPLLKWLQNAWSLSSWWAVTPAHLSFSGLIVSCCHHCFPLYKWIESLLRYRFFSSIFGAHPGWVTLKTILKNGDLGITVVQETLSSTLHYPLQRTFKQTFQWDIKGHQSLSLAKVCLEAGSSQVPMH